MRREQGRCSKLALLLQVGVSQLFGVPLAQFGVWGPPRVTGLALSCSALCRAADPADRGRVHPGWPEGARGQAGARPQHHPSPVCCASPRCRGTPLPMAPGLAGRAGGVGERSPPLFFLFKIFFPSFSFFLIFQPAEICTVPVHWGGAGVGGGGTSGIQEPSSPSPSRAEAGI